MPTPDTVMIPASQYFVSRYIPRVDGPAVSFGCFGLGLLWALTNKDRRAVHDLVMRTRVISA